MFLENHVSIFENHVDVFIKFQIWYFVSRLENISFDVLIYSIIIVGCLNMMRVGTYERLAYLWKIMYLFSKIMYLFSKIM